MGWMRDVSGIIWLFCRVVCGVHRLDAPRGEKGCWVELRSQSTGHSRSLFNPSIQ